MVSEAPPLVRHYGFALGEYGRVHTLLELPSGWLVGVPAEIVAKLETREAALYIADPEIANPATEATTEAFILRDVSDIAGYESCGIPATDAPGAPSPRIVSTEHTPPMTTLSKQIQNLRRDNAAAIRLLELRVKRLEESKEAAGEQEEVASRPGEKS